ncbi:MAG: hypothetical protein AAFX00_12240, partial [Pseudomonadota bacterium]
MISLVYRSTLALPDSVLQPLSDLYHDATSGDLFGVTYDGAQLLRFENGTNTGDAYVVSNGLTVQGTGARLQGWYAESPLLAVGGHDFDDPAVFRLAGSGPVATSAFDFPAAALLDAEPGQAVTDREGRTYLIAADGDTVSSRLVESDGSQTPVDVDGVADNLWVQTPGVVKTVTQNQRSYALVASSGSNSITVMEVMGSGKLFATDHVFDDQRTRFAGVKSLEVLTLGDTVFVAAAGSDDGVSVFRLLPGGKLQHLSSMADAVGRALNNVSSLSLSVSGNALHVHASSETDAGVALLTADLSGLGEVITGSVAGETLVGTNKDDVLVGGAGSDVLSGGAGADILRDGTGEDVLTGGAGADIFQLVMDGSVDLITDFDVSMDSLDLS